MGFWNSRGRWDDELVNQSHAIDYQQQQQQWQGAARHSFPLHQTLRGIHSSSEFGSGPAQSAPTWRAHSVLAHGTGALSISIPCLGLFLTGMYPGLIGVCRR